MGASHSLANTGVLPEVSFTIRPAGFSCANDVIAKSSCAANVTVANTTVREGARTSTSTPICCLKPISRRCEHKSTAITTNRSFKEWHEVFPNAAFVVSLIDRLVHRYEIVAIEGESYRLKEAKARAELKAATRAGTPRKGKKT